MDSGLYAAYSGLLARTQALDMAANNLANAGTNGFRAERSVFRSVLAEASDAASSQVGTAVNQFGVLSGTHVGMAQGQVQATGNPLDLAIHGNGFFMVNTPAGVRYTRSGSFALDKDGALVTRDGNQVLDATGKVIRVPSGEVTVSIDGTVSVSNGSGSAITGRIALMDLGQGALPAEGAGLYQAAPGSTPSASDASIQQGALEGSNEDAVHGTLQLLLVQRQAEMMQRALTVFHNDFDKTATEELAKV